MTAEIRKVIVAGEPPMLELCADTLRLMVDEVHIVLLSKVDHGKFDLRSLSVAPPDGWMAFAAIGNELLNLRRLGLMSQIRGLGYRLVSIVSRGALVPPLWQPSENVFIGDGAIVEPRVKMRHNTHVGAGAVLGVGAVLGHSVWVGARAIIGAEAEIGDGTVIAPGAYVADRTRIGRQCDLGVSRSYANDVPDRTFFSPMFDEPVQFHSPRPEAGNKVTSVVSGLRESKRAAQHSNDSGDAPGPSDVGIEP